MLTGVRIIDFTNYLPGPFASLRLAELGAEVIKIESLAGDPARTTGREKDSDGPVFRANNRNKQSITLNLKNDQGRNIALKLIEKADVVIESFRPKVMEKLGLDYESVKKIKPDIVYCSITGFGNDGEISSQGSHDLNYLAISGVLAQLKDERGKPIHPKTTLADYFGGIATSEKVLAGLVFKYRTGKGSYHCISIAEVMMSMMGNHVLIEQEIGYPYGASILNGNIVSYAIYETIDGRYITLCALEKKFWREFCLAVGKEGWVEEHFTPTSNKKLFSEIQALFKSRTFNEWIQFGQKVDCCLAPVLETSELREFPFLKEKEALFYSAWGDIQVKMHSDQSTISSAPPKKGEHTKVILKELLNLTEEDINSLLDDEVI